LFVRPLCQSEDGRVVVSHPFEALRSVSHRHASHTAHINLQESGMATLKSLLKAAVIALATGAWVASVAQQPSPAGAAAAAGAGGSTSANGGTGGVGLGGTGPAVSAGVGSTGGVGASVLGRPPGTGALVGPRARKEADALPAEGPAQQDQLPRNAGARAILLDQSQRPDAEAQPAK
jgi:hypothetical protein